MALRPLTRTLWEGGALSSGLASVLWDAGKSYPLSGPLFPGGCTGQGVGGSSCLPTPLFIWKALPTRPASSHRLRDPGASPPEPPHSSSVTRRGLGRRGRRTPVEAPPPLPYRGQQSPVPSPAAPPRAPRSGSPARRASPGARIKAHMQAMNYQLKGVNYRL